MKPDALVGFSPRVRCGLCHFSMNSRFDCKLDIVVEYGFYHRKVPPKIMATASIINDHIKTRIRRLLQNMFISIATYDESELVQNSRPSSLDYDLCGPYVRFEMTC